jgi:hypothetical protein
MVGGIEMNLPGFTAASSLHEDGKPYRMLGSVNPEGGEEVVPAIIEYTVVCNPRLCWLYICEGEHCFFGGIFE